MYVHSPLYECVAFLQILYRIQITFKILISFPFSAATTRRGLPSKVFEVDESYEGKEGFDLAKEVLDKIIVPRRHFTSIHHDKMSIHGRTTNRAKNQQVQVSTYLN